MDKLDKVWERIRGGRHTAVLGSLPADLPAGCGFYAVRVSCAGTLPALGPLRQARAQIEELLGGPLPILDQAAERVWTGLRRRLLGEVPEVLPGSALVESLNRLRGTEGRWAVVLEDVESADEDTLNLLREMVTRPNWLKVPLLLAFGRREPLGHAGALITALTAAEGDGGLIQIDGAEDATIARREPPPQSLRGLPAEIMTVLRAGALIGSGFEADLIAALLNLTPLRVLELLQAAADLGVPLEDDGDERFNLTDDLSQGLRASTLPSLAIAWHRRLADLLSQEPPRPAEEPGPPEAPIDLEHTHPGVSPSGIFAVPVSRLDAQDLAGGAIEEMPPELATPGGPIIQGIQSIPDIQGAQAPRAEPPEPDAGAQAPWQYAELFPGQSAGSPVPERAGAAVPRSSPGIERGTPGEPSEPGTADPNRPYSVLTGAPRAPRAEAVPVAVPSRRERSEPRVIAPVEIRIGDRPAARSATTSHEEPSQSSVMPSDVSTRMRIGEPLRKGDGLSAGNEARAATHLVAAGDVENGAARYLAAAREAAAVGAFVQAVAYAREALGLIEGLPASPRRRRLRVLALCELGRLQWQAAGPGGKFTLASAVEVLQAAQQLLEDDDPVDLRTTVSTLLASVQYDIGDLPSLERALDELTRASRALLESGDAVGAARLLNDQAAVYVRLGDPVRAAHLLAESRRVFQRLEGSDPTAAAELAETDHLFARLPLHVAARPGREADAIEMGKSHARAAERAYRQLGATRELTRVWETMGRLELRADRLDRALQSLGTALEAQRELGDVLGLARTTAALSEVLARGGKYDDALSLLAESIALNLEKGSPLGLAYNRRSLDALAQALPDEAGLAVLHQEVARKLAAAEAVLGRIRLPGES